MISLKNKKIVITGGAGFIGSHVSEALLAEGAQVVIVDDFSTGREENIASCVHSVTLVRGSITDLELMKKACADAFAVVHLAALPSVPKSIQFPLETHAANSTGTLAVLMAAHESGVDLGGRRTIRNVYGDTPTLPKVETMPTHPLSFYAIHKLTGELYARVSHSLFGLKTIGLRYFNVFGPRQNPHSEYAAVIPKFVTLIKQGTRPQIYGDGEHTRDFTYVANVVHANIQALKAEQGFGEVFNIAGGKQISLNDLVRQINTHFGSSISPEYAPARKGDIKDSFADISKARQVLGFEPVVNFEDGLKKTIDSL